MSDEALRLLEESIARDEGMRSQNEEALSLLEQSLGNTVSPRRAIPYDPRDPNIGMFREQQQEYDVRAREQRFAEIQERLNVGESYVDEPFGDRSLNFDIERSIEPEDVRTKFLREYPNGDFKVVTLSDGSRQFLGRRNPEEPFRNVGGGVGSVASTLVSGPTAGAILGAPFGPLGMAIGAGLGEGVDRLIERARGLESDVSGARIAGRMGTEAAISYGVDKFLGILGRRRLRPLSDEQVEAVEAQLRLELPELQKGQIAGDAVQTLYGQMLPLSRTARTRSTEQRTAALNSLRELSESQVEGLSDASLNRALELQRQEIYDLLPRRGEQMETAGPKMQAALQNWEKLSSQAIDNAYADFYRKSRELGVDVAFDSSSLRRLVRERRRGVRTEGRSVDIEDTGLVDASGAPITRENRRLVRAGYDFENNRELRAIAEAIDELPNGVFSLNNNETAFAFLIALRKQAGRMMGSQDPDARAFAKELWGEISSVMDAPIEGMPSDLRRSFDEANNLFRRTREVQELSYIQRAMETDTPSEIARKFINPDNPEVVGTLRGVMSTSDWQEAKDYFMEDFATSVNPSTALNRLDQWRQKSPDTLRLVLTEKEEGILRTALERRQQLESGPVQRAIDQNLSEGQRGLALIAGRNVNPTQIKSLIESSGGVDGATATSLRAAIWNDILQGGAAPTRTGEDLAEVLDYRGVLRRINSWENNPNKRAILDALFDSRSMQILNDYKTYSRAASSPSVDVGGQLQVAETLQSGVMGASEAALGNTKKLQGFIHKMMTIGGVASYLSRPVRYTELARYYDNNEAMIRRFSFSTQQMIRELEREAGTANVLQSNDLLFNRPEESEYTTTPVGGG